MCASQVHAVLLHVRDAAEAKLYVWEPTQGGYAVWGLGRPINALSFPIDYSHYQSSMTVQCVS